VVVARLAVVAHDADPARRSPRRNNWSMSKWPAVDPMCSVGHAHPAFAASFPMPWEFMSPAKITCSGPLRASASTAWI
jgi:hypothetical protein